MIRDETDEALAIKLGATPADLRFEVDVIPEGLRGEGERFLTDGHDDALAWGTEAVARWGQGATQVTLTATTRPYVHGTFATRHLHHQHHYSGKADSGWRCWRDNAFIGGLPDHSTGESE